MMGARDVRAAVFLSCLGATMVAGAVMGSQQRMDEGFRQMNEGQFGRAIESFEAVVRAQPENRKAVLALGAAYAKLGRHGSAIEVLEPLVKQSTTDYISRNNLAWVLVAKRNQPDLALAVVDEVRKGSGPTPVAAEKLPPAFLDTIGLVYQKLARPDKYPEMQAMFEAAVKRYPNDPRMYLYRSREDDEIIGEMRIKPATVVRMENAHARFEVALTMRRPQAAPTH